MNALALALALAASAGPAAPEQPVELLGPGSFLVAPKAGLLLAPNGMGAAFDGALELGWRTPLLDRKLVVALEGNFARPGRSGQLSDPRLASGVSGAWQLELRQVAVALSAVYRFDDAFERLTPYIGLGPTLSFDQAETTAFGSTTTEKAGRWGALAQVGAEYALWHGGALLEARYHLTRVVFTSTGNAAAGGFELLAGYRFHL